MEKNNTPSPEAKQAADERGCKSVTSARGYFCEGYDTATAKAREFAAMQDKIILAAAQENAKLREELELAWVIIANASGGDWSKESQEWQDAAAKWRDRVMPAISAHQLLDSARDKQPSAITTNEQAYRDGTLSQPSANCRINTCFRKADESGYCEKHKPSAPTAEELEPLPAKFLREDGKGFINI